MFSPFPPITYGVFYSRGVAIRIRSVSLLGYFGRLGRYRQNRVGSRSGLHRGAHIALAMLARGVRKETCTLGQNRNEAQYLSDELRWDVTITDEIKTPTLRGKTRRVGHTKIQRLRRPPACPFMALVIGYPHLNIGVSAELSDCEHPTVHQALAESGRTDPLGMNHRTS